MQNIFVYGTLKRGQEWAWGLAGQQFLLEVTTTPEYWMFDLGTYPGLVDADGRTGDRISGEVYRVDAKCRRQLDEIECVDSGMYELREIRLEGTSDADCLSEPVFAYFYLGGVEGCKRLRIWQ